MPNQAEIKTVDESYATPDGGGPRTVSPHEGGEGIRNSLMLQPGKDSDRVHLQATFYHYLLFCQANKAASTHRIYQSTLWAFYRWWSQERPYETLGPTLLHAYKIWLCQSRDQGQERLQARSINNYLAAVRAFCRWIHARYPLSWDPGREIPDERVDNKTYQRLPLSPTQVTTLIGSFDDSLIGLRDAAMTYIMAKTGLRAIQIQRADCGDLECLEVQVYQGKDGRGVASDATVIRAQWILRTQGKGQQTKESFVNLMPEVYNRLQRYLEARGPVSSREPLFARHHDKLTTHLEQVRSKPGGAEGSTLAPNERLRLTTRAIQLRIAGAMTRCGLRDVARPGEASPLESRRRRQRRVTPHSLRHTAATEAARTESPFKVQAMLDHKDIRTTQKYFHAIDRLEEGAEYAITRY
ncbi:MAG TPA: tyrosine-type recombinase/integrase [Nitrospira sp.]|jgi:integrase/recombinase XerD|nr:tyrosine-type recombinase/integrase [Nitrospira sp.]HNP84315.1 tyrosine-type recombinase/integrase [Nitrospira sp.]